MRGKPTGFIHHMRKIVRGRFNDGSGREFTATDVREIAARECNRFEGYKDDGARDGAIRRLMQDERRDTGLVFAVGRRGHYFYPSDASISLDSHKSSNVDVPLMTPLRQEAFKSLQSLPSREARAILESLDGVMLFDDLDPVYYDRVIQAAEKYHLGDEIEVSVKAPRINMSPGKRGRWAESEIIYLEESAGRVNVTEIAAHLGRTLGSVRLKAFQLRLSLLVRAAFKRKQPESDPVMDAVVRQRESFAAWCLANGVENSERGYIEWCERESNQRQHPEPLVKSANTARATTRKSMRAALEMILAEQIAEGYKP